MGDYRNEGIGKTGKDRKPRTSPELAGPQNLEGHTFPTISEEEAEFNKKLYRMFRLRMGTQTGNWTEEQFDEEILKFFDYCEENDMNPSPPMLCMWLNADSAQLSRWRRSSDSPAYRPITKAMKMMESRVESRLEKYPVGNIFRLKAYHDVVEPNKVEVVGTTKVEIDPESVAKAVEKLGLSVD